MRQMPGFSLIELMVVAVISGVLFSGGIVAYRSISGKQQVKQAGISFQTNLRLFQQRALAGEKPAECTTADKFLGYEVSYVAEDSYSVSPLCEGKVTTAVSWTLDNEVIFTAPWPESLRFNNLRSDVDGAQTIYLSKIGLSYSYQVVIEPSGVIRSETVLDSPLPSSSPDLVSPSPSPSPSPIGRPGGY
ncbi:MAG: prepilin-type N-terminal cleavage/methylation domain-containing protein [Candidatus Beckwithbacteria bacterium]